VFGRFHRGVDGEPLSAGPLTNLFVTGSGPVSLDPDRSHPE